MLGFILIGICFAYVVYNTIVIVVYSLRILWVYLRRIYVLCHRKRLRKEVLHITKKLNSDKEKDCLNDDDIEK